MEVFYDKFRCLVGEGPLWDADNNRLLFLDILSKCIFISDFNTGNTERIDVGQNVGCMALCANGDILLGMQDGVYRLNSQKEIKPAHKPVKIKGTRFNDGKAGPDGCFYLGTCDDNKNGAFYRLKDGILTELFVGCGCSNGLDWSMDETKMFYCDTPNQKIEVFDFDKNSGSLSNRRDYVEIPPEMGKPDGFTMDSEDNIHLALWDGASVLEIKNGEIVKKTDVPAKKASCCCFAGKELDTLIITSASKGDEKDYPLAGYVFKTKALVKGKNPYKYKY